MIAMPMPMEYRQASVDFDRFILDACELAGLQTTNQAYTMVQAVLRTFRRRLDIEDAILFADVLPPVVRAIFVAEWDVEEPRSPFSGRVAMTREVQSLRPDHNISPDSAIADVAAALRRNIDEAKLDRVLARLPPGAADFWRA
ncbi:MULTISPECIES: DUF2267 domain-containing protein [unclassified Ensifer]|uniref:DUF2267 domain-containing protein n=1 Tax=unclassified Ensifer TaxID=2633371 RepID=UPI0008137F65|nr:MULTISPECIES: DUF2267 domain-containing protein [unclassified Ensifer]OCP01119.1 hypothetical protein BC362_21930 [Ensifer sp. LC14]OCP05382.1 hypothetical protein BBX50_24140 [Ensifer sp. LC11]OCP05993.1 hypothetical protein BC374_24360 [Ensifer sp. LC13]OCP30816.1 hypothetical protein BC364_23990 [Ensifer sp. LC499]